MESSHVNRRDFSKLTMAALGGVVAGTAASQGSAEAAEKQGRPEIHVCRGLNTCAGTSVCATAGTHTCGGQNACKGQGGCGASPGHNSCKGQGKCAVPLSKKSWQRARKQFEARMKKAGKKVGVAPPARKA